MEFNGIIIGGGCVGASILAEASTRVSHLALVDHGRMALSATAHSGGLMRVFHESIQHIELALGHQALLKDYVDLDLLPSPKHAAAGGLYVFHRDRLANYHPGLRKMMEAQVPFEVLTHSQLVKRFSQFVWKEDDTAIFEPLAARMDPLSFTHYLLKESESRGAKVFENFEVTRVCPYLDRYRVSGPQGTITARTVVLAGGARLLPLLRGLGLALDIEARELTSYLAEAPLLEGAPSIFDRETLHYGSFEKGFPTLLSTPDFNRLASKPFASFQKVVGMDAYAKGRQGFLGQVPGHRGLFIATGWGGTAFKFSLEIGRRIAIQLEKECFEGRPSYGQC